jgi:hypothetical protein
MWAAMSTCSSQACRCAALTVFRYAQAATQGWRGALISVVLPKQVDLLMDSTCDRDCAFVRYNAAPRRRSSEAPGRFPRLTSVDLRSLAPLVDPVHRPSMGCETLLRTRLLKRTTARFQLRAELTALVARRRQLLTLQLAERQRLQMASELVRPSIEEMIAAILAQIAAIDAKL